jgi:hypothetical protein
VADPGDRPPGLTDSVKQGLLPSHVQVRRAGLRGWMAGLHGRLALMAAAVVGMLYA